MGKIRHKSAQGEKLYNGNQPVIIAQDLWDQVQARLAVGTQGACGADGLDATHAALGAEGDQDARKVQTAVGVNSGQGDSANRSGARHAISQSSQISLLAGKLFDDMGQPLVATHACKPARRGSNGNKIRYRYYVSRHLQHGDAAARDGSAATARLGGPPHTGRTVKDFDATTPHGLRIPAREVEQLVVDRLAAAITDPLALIERMGATLPDNADLAAMTTTAIKFAEHLKTTIPAHVQSLLDNLIDCIIVRHDEIQIMLNPLVLLQLFILPQLNDIESVVLTVPVKLKRAGMAMKMILPNGSAAVQRLPDTILIGAIKRGRAWWQRLQHERGLTVEALARDQKLSPTYVTRQIKLAFLDPQIITDILRGDVPAGLTVDRLERIAANHPIWADQRTALQRADQ